MLSWAYQGFELVAHIVTRGPWDLLSTAATSMEDGGAVFLATVNILG